VTDINFDLCGCGKVGKYMVDGESACNKYKRCKSHDALLLEIGDYKQQVVNLELDLMNAKIAIGDLTLKLRIAEGKS
jgi:hypothetical protein